MSLFPERGLPDNFPPFAAFRREFGFVPQIFRAQTLLPRLIEAEAAIAESVLLRAGGLTRLQKERLLLAVAAAKSNGYCLTVHGHFLRALGVSQEQLARIGDDPRADLGEADRALLDFVLELSERPTAIARRDVERLRRHGFADEQILEAVLTTALSKFLCTLAVGVGARPDFDEPVTVRRPAVPRRRGSARPDGEPGPYLRSVALDDDFPPFAFFRRSFGFVPNLFRAQTLRPDVIEAEAEVVAKVLLTEDVLSRRIKEYILLVVSAANLNNYCVAVHCEMLRRLGVAEQEYVQIAADHHQAGLAETEAALLDFALKLSRRPDEYGPADLRRLRERGLSREQALEAVVMTALTEFLNTLQTGLASVPDFPRPVGLATQRRRVSAVNPVRPPGRPTTGDAIEDENDAELVERARHGNIEAFGELVLRHSGRVYRTLVAMVHDPSDAEDGTQTVFLKAFRHVKQFHGTSKFSTWLTRIAIHVGVEQLRETRRAREVGTDDPEAYRPRLLRAWVDDPERLYSREETRRLVENALLGLPEKYRLVVMLRDLERLSGEETAAVLGLKPATMKTRLLRGRLMLREALAPHYAHPAGDRRA